MLKDEFGRTDHAEVQNWEQDRQLRDRMNHLFITVSLILMKEWQYSRHSHLCEHILINVASQQWGLLC